MKQWLLSRLGNQMSGSPHCVCPSATRHQTAPRATFHVIYQAHFSLPSQPRFHFHLVAPNLLWLTRLMMRILLAQTYLPEQSYVTPHWMLPHVTRLPVLMPQALIKLPPRVQFHLHILSRVVNCGDVDFHWWGRTPRIGW